MKVGTDTSCFIPNKQKDVGIDYESLGSRFIYLVIITKLLEVSLFNVFPWMSLLKLIVSALLAGACILPILSIGLSYLMAILVSGAVFSIVYLIVFRILKPLNKSELKSVKGLIPKPLRWVL